MKKRKKKQNKWNQQKINLNIDQYWSWFNDWAIQLYKRLQSSNCIKYYNPLHLFGSTKGSWNVYVFKEVYCKFTVSLKCYHTKPGFELM